MVSEYTKQISDLLEKINEEHDSDVKSLIAYETSTELCVGSQLVRYGELYKIILACESFDEIAQSLEGLFYKDKFETYEDDIEKLQEQVFRYIKSNYSFVIGKKMLLDKIKDDYIFSTIERCL